MITLDGQLETSDMTFAVVLCLNGFHPLMERRGQVVWWTLDDDNDTLRGIISEYQRGHILVEPRRFAREFAAMRKDVYGLLGVGAKGHGVRVARSADHAS